MKRKTAKEIMAESFRELAAVKKIDKITVKDITDNCGYSPATFYRQFKDKYDLIAWDYAQDVENNLRELTKSGLSWQDSLYKSAQYYLEHKDYLVNLFNHAKGLYSFEQYMAAVNAGYIKGLIEKKAGKMEPLAERCLWSYCYGGAQITSDWLLGRFSASAEEITETYSASLPEILRRLLEGDETNY